MTNDAIRFQQRYLGEVTVDDWNALWVRERAAGLFQGFDPWPMLIEAERRSRRHGVVKIIKLGYKAFFGVVEKTLFLEHLDPGR